MPFSSAMIHLLEFVLKLFLVELVKYQLYILIKLYAIFFVLILIDFIELFLAVLDFDQVISKIHVKQHTLVFRICL